MFWGLIIEPNKRYTQTVDKPFHVSMATLDVSTADDEIVQVMLCYENRNYLLCNLKKGHVWQVPLDLNFQEGTKIAFTSNGRGHVHLTGYLVPDDEMDDLDELEDEDEEEEEEEEVPQLVGKRKAKNSPTERKAAKRLKESVKEVAEEEDDSSDDDGLLDGLMPDDDSEDDEDDELEEEEEDDDDNQIAEDEEDEEDEDEEEEEEEEKEVKPQKKGKQNKSQQKKEEKQIQQKQALVNGKDKKAEKSDKKSKDIQNDSQMQKKRIISGGIQVEELKVGQGAPAKPGKFLSVYYVGKLANGKKFDSTTQGDGFKFRLGKGEVIKGWDVGVQGMKVGGKRRLTIPPQMAYGAKGSPPVIPGNSTLVFEIELKRVH
ncbi:46 kDa FK506-binding nuclear protein [Fopius arisanus]|uniref:FK506-binding protein n=1 Tax=Fopius arisanus TaxID=64838 RepID=A0A0C9R7Y0_9HYME|nr:PREDICTED: 46 kDa FK506-binding nuclear protein [Fopius arisanus]